MPQNPDKSWSLHDINADGIPVPEDWGGLMAAHIDTGVTRGHPALGSWVRIDLGVNYIEKGQEPVDPLHAGTGKFPGHGTRTSSVLTGWQEGIFRGVVPKLPIIPYRVSETVIISDHLQENVHQNMADAIYHAIGHGCQVISISMGIPGLSKDNVLGRAIDHAYNAGVIVCAAGGQGIDRFCYPAKFFRAIGVGGYKGYPKDKNIYQSYGLQGSMNTFADVWAPAEPIWRAEALDLATDKASPYGWGDGTSFATPHVAGTAALWLHARRQDLVRAYAKPWMRIEAFRLLLRQTARNLGKSGYQGFDQMRPATSDDYLPLPRKGDQREGMNISGGLNAKALLDAPLPDAKELTEVAATAENQTR